MPDKIDISSLGNFLKSNVDISKNVDRFSNNSSFANKNSYVVDDYVKSTYAEEIKKAKAAKDEAYKQTGHSEEEAKEASKSSEFWTGLFNTAKGAIMTANPLLASSLLPGSGKSVDDVKQEVSDAFYQNKALGNALKNGVVNVYWEGGKKPLQSSLAGETDLMDKDDILDNIKYAIGIEENILGDKKLSISSKGLGDFFYFLDKDEKGNDVLGKAPIKDKKKFEELGKTVLNAYGAVPLFKGGTREFLAQLSNTYSGLAENLVNVNRAASNVLADATEDPILREYAIRSTKFGQTFSDNLKIQQSQAGVGGLTETLASGTGQGLSSMVQMAILGAGTGMLGSVIAPGASAAGKLQAITNFGAGAILNFNEAYKSALDAGLDETKAASIGALTGAVNGLIESSIGTNRLFNWMSGGGDKALARAIMNDLGEEVTEKGINRVFNNFKKGISGDVGSFLNKIFEKPVLGTALEEATEEFLQTYSQKANESLYDAFIAGDKQVGKGKFGTDVFSKDTFVEAMESAMYGAILGAGGDIVKTASDRLQGKKHIADNDIIPLIAEGRRNEIDAVIKSMHGGKLMSDSQRDFYLGKIDALDKMYNANEGLFTTIDKSATPEVASQIKKEALSLVNEVFSLNKTNESLNRKLADINNEPGGSDVEKQNRSKRISEAIQENTLMASYYNQLIEEDYTPNENGEIPAVKKDYANNEEIIGNKVKRAAIGNHIKTLQSKYDSIVAEIQKTESLLNNPVEGDTMTDKEYGDKINNLNANKDVVDRYLQNKKAELEEKLDEYKKITSKEYQEEVKAKKAEVPVVQPTVTTPVAATPEVSNENNSETQTEIKNAPVVTRESLQQEYRELAAILNGPEDMDPGAIQDISDRMNLISMDLEELNRQNAGRQAEYTDFVKENNLRFDALAKLDPVTSEEALSVVKKDIEQVMAGFKSEGIDTKALEELHGKISAKILQTREAIVAASKPIEEPKAEPVTKTNFFNRLQRLPFMEANPDFYTEAEFKEIFANTPVSEILNEVSITFTPPPTLGYTAGQKLGGSMKAVVPNIIVTLRYRGKGLGNINQVDGFESTDPGFFNLDNNGYQAVKVRNAKLEAIANFKDWADPTLSASTLAELGFTLNWNGQFLVDNNVPRTLVKDLEAAKLAENGGAVYIYDRVRQLEVTNGMKNMREEPNVPAIPEGLEERYVVLVKANNGKYYWVPAQNQILDEKSQTGIYKALFKSMNEVKAMTDEQEIKDKVSEINKYLANDVFVSVPYATLQFTTPNKTNKNFGLRLKVKGQKSKNVTLDATKFGTMSDLLNELGLKSSNLRKAFGLDAPVDVVINTLAVATDPAIIANNDLQKSILFDFDDSKVNSYVISAPVVETAVADDTVNDTITNPFDGYDISQDPTLDDIEDVITIPDTEVKALEDEDDGDVEILDLTAYDPSYNNLSYTDQKAISIAAFPLYGELLETTSKLKKKGLEQKIKGIIAQYTSDDNPVFSIGEAEEIMDYPEAVAWLESRLPASIGIEDINNLLGNIKNNGTTFGAFANNIIYLNNVANKGTQYHEAFHAVFRTFLTDNQIKVVMNVARGKYGNPTEQDIISLRNSSTVYHGYSDSKLKDLWLEEKLANEFQSHLNTVDSKSKLAKIWNKIVDFFNFVVGNMDQVEALFYNINRGKFKNATRVNNIFSSYSNQDKVFSIYSKGLDENGNTITTTQAEGQAVVARLTNKYIKALKAGRTDRNQIIEELLDEQVKFYSIDENPYYEMYLERENKLDDDAFIDEMSNNLTLKRNIYSLPKNRAAIKKDILSKAKIFDIDAAKATEDYVDEVDDIGERHDVATWTIGGETSFSTVLRTYISLATIDTFDEYGQATEEAVDFKKVYRGLVRALAGVEEDNVLPRLKMLAEFDEDINAVYKNLMKDLGLVDGGNLETQNITRNYDLWRKFVTAFNNEKVGWYTILHSKEQSRLIESNTASAKDLQFNDWYQNYSITHQELEFNTELKKRLNSSLDYLNRTENLQVSSFEEAKQNAEEIRKAFRAASIKLSNAYITYSLLKKSDYSKLDQAGKDFLEAFAGNDGLYDGGNIPFIVSEFKSGFNPFETIIDDKKKERGAVTRLKTIADQNALFDPTVGDSSFQNADGKNVYSIIRPSFGLVKLRWLRDAKTRERLLNEDRTKKDDFISPNGEVLNHLLAHPETDLVFKGLSPSMIDGYRQTTIEGDTERTDDAEGATFGKFSGKQYLLSDFLMFLSNRRSINKINQTGKSEKVAETAMFNINQMESSSTGYGVFLPVENYNGAINDAFLDKLYGYFLQEVNRIKKVREEFGKPGTKTWLSYNDTLNGRGFKFTEFADYGLEKFLDEDINVAEVKELMKVKLEKDIAEYKDILLSAQVDKDLPPSELEKRGYKQEGKPLEAKNFDKLVNDYYLNAYLNTLGINNLLLDNYSKKVKNSVDWFKRAKGIIGSGPDMGKGTTIVGVYKEPVRYINTENLEDIDIDKLMSNKQDELEDGVRTPEQVKEELAKFEKDIKSGKIDIADAQSYVTLAHKIDQLKTWGRYPAQVERIYEKLINGQEITWNEKLTLEANNAALNSTKTVSYNGDYYFKLSELILTPRLVGRTEEDGTVAINPDGTVKYPKEGFEYLFNKYNAMIKQGVHQVLPLSASKMATVSPAEFAEDGNFDFSGHTMEIENKFKRLQVETPSGKTHIIHGTQLIQLVHGEQDDLMEIDFPYNDEVKTLGDLRKMYRQLLADNRLESFKQALAYVKDPLSGEFNSKELTKKFYNTIVEGGGDEVMSNFFAPDHNGERQFNWNLGPVINKAEQLFLAHFSKGVLSQKVSGLKVSLVSDAGIYIKDKQTGKMRSLKHMVQDEDGNYYSECLLPPFAEELLGTDPSDEKVRDVLKMFGIRIPTQDKHSMMSLKVVGFLPVEYGSVGVFAKEIVYLSGADFDIDSEFIHRLDFYVDENGKLTPYGTAKTDEGKFKEYVEWNKENNKLLKSKKRDYNSIEEAMKAIGLASTLEEFIQTKPTNIGTNDNAMVWAQIKFLTNDYVRNRAALIPSSMDSIKAVAKAVTKRLGLGDKESVSPNTPLARYNANRNNMEGSAGIGPVALANVSHSLLSTSGVKLLKSTPALVINNHKAKGFGDIYTIDSDTNRKNDNISTLLSAMTDNAKEQMARLLNLSFNSLPTDTLPVASYMLSLGYTMEEAVLFLNLPSIKAYTASDAKIQKSVDDLYERLLKVIEAKAKEQEVSVDDEYIKDYMIKHKPALTTEFMLENLTVNNDTDPHVYIALEYAKSAFEGLQAQASYTQSISSLLSLNKGLKSTFDDNLKTDGALDRLQLTFVADLVTADILSVEDLLRKLERYNIIKREGNKVTAGKEFPGFEVNKNPNITPYDARLAILNDPNTLQNIIIHKQVGDISKEYFLLNTDVFKRLKNLVNTPLKDMIPFFMDKANRNYMEVMFPEKYADFMEATDNAGFMVHKGGVNTVGRDLYNLKKDPKFRDNMLIKLLTLRPPTRGSKLVQIEFPTRVKAEGDFYTELNNAFKELFMNPQTTMFARKLYYYSYFKNGLQFKNKSFINTIPSWVFKDVSASLDVLNADFKDNNFDDYSSLQNGIIPTMTGMLKTFGRLSTLAQQLPRTPFTGKQLKVYNTVFDKNTKVSTINVIDADTSNVENYLQSLKDLNAKPGYADLLENELGGFLPYRLGAHDKSTSFESNAVTITSRVIEKVRGFDVTGTPRDFSLDEAMEYYLNHGHLPRAYEVSYKINDTVITETGLTSTAIDDKFIDAYADVVKSIPKDKTADPIMVDPILAEAALEDEVGYTENPIAETDESPFTEDNLENTENNSTFVNPFMQVLGEEDTLASLGLDASDFDDYNNIVEDSFNLDDINDTLDGTQFLDDSGNPIC